MAKQKAAVASMNPDEMVPGGLPDDFDGEITEVRLVPWDYDGKMDHHMLAARVTIDTDEGDTVVQHYSAGDLQQFVPSKDGDEPVDLEGEGEELEGIYALRVGRREALNNNTNWAHFVVAAIDAGFDKDQLGGAVDVFEGVRGHFDRIPQIRRKGLANDDGRTREILVLTSVEETKPATKSRGKGKGAAKTATKTRARKSTKAADNDNGELDERIAAALIEGLEANDGELTKAKLPRLVIAAFDAKEKAKAVKRASDPEFLGRDDLGFIFDADEGVLYSAA